MTESLGFGIGEVLWQAGKRRRRDALEDPKRRINSGLLLEFKTDRLENQSSSFKVRIL